MSSKPRHSLKIAAALAVGGIYLARHVNGHDVSEPSTQRWRARRWLEMVAVSALLACPISVAATTFDVDDEVDLFDAVPGDGFCATPDHTCSLRAAIEESNLLPGTDIVDIPRGMYQLGGRRLLLRDDISLLGESADTTTIMAHKLATVNGQIVDLTDIALVAEPKDFLVCGYDSDTVLRFGYQGEPKDELIARGAGGLDNPTAVLERGDDVFVAGFNSGVHRLNGETGKIDVFVPSGTGEDQVLGASDLLFVNNAAGTRVDLLVVNGALGGGIKRFDGVTGAFRDEFIPAGAGGLAFPASMVLSEPDQRSLLVTSTGTNEVLKFDLETGSAQGAFVTRGSGTLRSPRGLTFGPDGNLYVASEGRDPVLRYNGRTGEFIDAFIKRGPGELIRPNQLLFFDQILYVVSGSQILRFSQTGAPMTPLVGVDAGVRQPACIAQASAVGVGPQIEIAKLKIAGGRGGISIASNAVATITDSVFQGNAAFFHGGAIQNAGDLLLVRTTLISNSAPSGSECGGASGGGALFNSGLANILGSTFTDNESRRGGAIYNRRGALLIRNSTISGNRALCGGAGIANSAGDADISFTTITDNSLLRPVLADPAREERGGGGIFNGGTMTLGSSIIVGNTSASVSSRSTNQLPNDCETGRPSLSVKPSDLVMLTTAGNNLVGTIGSCGTILQDICEQDLPSALRNVCTQQGPAHLSDQFGIDFTDLLLDSVLRLNLPGRTPTHALFRGSPAVDAVTFNRADCPRNDQRGVARPGKGSTLCDAGAYEQNPRQ